LRMISAIIFSQGKHTPQAEGKQLLDYSEAVFATDARPGQSSWALVELAQDLTGNSRM